MTSANEVRSARWFGWRAAAARTAAAISGAGLLLAAGSAGATLTLFEGNNFDGARIRLDSPMPDLDRTPFNDRARSMIIRDVTWELCSDARYRGSCRIFRPGRYSEIPDLSAQVSSARPVGNASGGGGWGGIGGGGRDAGGRDVGGRDGGGRSRGDGGDWERSAATLFESVNFDGARISIDGPIQNLDRTDFNDRARSIVIRYGSWELCTDAYFRGSCRVFRPGSYSLQPEGLDARISSLRPVSP